MTTTAHDPVCHMDIDPATYYFCSLGCKKAFDENPEKYLGKTDEHAHQH